ncbi:hypothetical protein B0O80DRAFT_462697 [Mortierella sp. GBAus27b]|nr:hypothetical protein B0O80DRAFT_462697 [Mortierella sp. GBAus27b]
MAEDSTRLSMVPDYFLQDDIRLSGQGGGKDRTSGIDGHSGPTTHTQMGLLWKARTEMHFNHSDPQRR